MTDTAAAPAGAAQRTTAYAWVVLVMLAFIYIFNFLDRQLMSTVIESIKRDTGFTDAEMGYMTGFLVCAGLYDIRRHCRLSGRPHKPSEYPFLRRMLERVHRPLRHGHQLSHDAGGSRWRRRWRSSGRAALLFDHLGLLPAEKRGTALAIFSLGVPFGQALAVALYARGSTSSGAGARPSSASASPA